MRWYTISFFNLLIFLFFACTPSDRHEADRLNELSYTYRYRNLDSTVYYSRKAYEAAENYSDGKAEALNNLGFVSITRMQYDKAKAQLDSVIELTDNQLELLVADVQQMRLCQRRSRNREFYDYREHAMKALKRINEERGSLTERQQKRLLYAESELAIVTSTYYYYVGLEEQSIEELHRIGPEVERDTAQWLNYLYNVGAGGMILDGDIDQQEFDYLFQCLKISKQFGSPYFYANSLEGIAEHLIDGTTRQRLIGQNKPSFDELNPMSLTSEELVVSLAQQALNEFIDYGDIYQIAGAYRTLASCYRAQGDYEMALVNLEYALSDSAIFQAPDLVASIREQLSVAYSAIDDKANSDYNRNLYLDLQEQTRQDRSLEARADQLDVIVAQLNILLAAIFVVLLLLLFSLRLFYVFYRRRQKKLDQLDELREQREDVEELLAISRQKRQEGERRNLDQRAKIFMVNSIIPLIDRMLHDVQRIDPNDAHCEERLQFVSELTDTINEQNNVLTHWIQLRRGELSLHIETFALQSLFDIIEKSKRSFSLKGITLLVEPTEAKVKADRVLTLFMLNTLADNARKFTGEGGQVLLSASEADNYVEISVADTGQGMDEEELAHVFDHKVSGGHGFGLLNCRGIMEKYRKTSQIFSVCRLAAESVKGQGSRFFFRLPKGLVRIVLLLLSFTASAHADEMLLQQAGNYADSAYYSNINGTYERTLEFADSCRAMLNAYYLSKYPDATDTLKTLGPSSYFPEIGWLHRDVQLNYSVLLVLRNESAVAALALHQWQLYTYNNRIYTLLFKELSADRTLDEYCRQMQQSQTDRMVAIFLLIFMAFVLLAAIAFQVIHAISRKAARQQEQESSLELLRDELRRTEMEEARLHVSNQVLENCLSTLKHETMYYPSRIRQLIEVGQTNALPEVVGYYRELYGILSEQAGRQIETIHLHLQPLDHELLGDKNLIGYLFDILRKLSRQKQLTVDYQPKDDKYTVCTVELPSVPPTNFMPTIENIPFLICRQIVREHGEATGRHGCGIISEATDNGSRIIITLPRQLCKTSK